ncbi:hypothetical protein [Paucibacter soli]|uniref:hypothetical protein n=1 Tax=Paucibacter soli TaxID=3133433 RepID=UPI0030B708DF
MSAPRLPSNPFSISDLRPQANTWTAESVEAKYAGKPMDAMATDSIQRDLDEIRAWDNYERCTSPNREAAKQALQALLDRSTRH